MNIGQFFRIVWAYKALILASAVICFAAGLTFVELVKPRYEAQSRVMLDVIKPDPVTGEVIGSAFLRAYTKTQTEMVKSQQVARMVVKDLQWEKDPAVQKAFRESGQPDFMTYAVERVRAGASADLIQGSNILEITYSSSSPAEAKRIADGLLKAYQDMTLQSRRETASRNAQWYEAQAEKAKTSLFAAESAKTNYERENGIILQDDKVDIDSARLAALATQGSAPIVATQGGGGMSAAEAQLATLDAEIAEQTKTLGPNHPLLQQLKTRRGILAQQAAQDRNLSSASSGAALSAARANSGMLEAQKAKVMAQREKVERLRLMQGEIDLRRDQYNRAVARAAQLRQEAEATEAGVTPLASATTPDSPAFPKKGMILGVSVPAGVVLGLLIGLVLELVGRRVRSAEDLSAAIAAPVLAVIRDPVRKAGKRGSGLPSLRSLTAGRAGRVARA